MGTNEYEDYLRKYHETDIYNISNGAKLPYEIVIDYENLEQVNSQLADLIIDKSDDCISKFQQAIRNLDVNSHNLLDKYGDEICSIRFKNLSEITPIRELTAENVGKLIQTKAIINNYSVKHELIIKRAVYECRSCMRLHEIEQDSKTPAEPTLCKECGGRSFKLLDDESTYVNFKELILSEPLEESDKGNSQKITAIITGENEFVGKIREYGEHGKRINVVGKLRMFKQDNTMYTGLEINNIWNDNDSSIILTDEDINEFKEWAKNDNILDDLVNKFAPINAEFDYEIKLALLCQNVGAGDLGNNRKEIHIIIVGDAGVGKTTLANVTTNLYEIYQKATGTGSTGAGLIGAVDRDSINGGWTYQAGKIILADGGLAVIDEFDKTNQDDQPKINDIMQDGKTSIDKADVHVYPKSNVSILALANPIGTDFDTIHDKIKQIDIAGSTLDRFDGLFILTSQYNSEKHLKIRKKKYQSYKQYNDELEDMEKLKKYLAYVKKEFNPKFTAESEQEGLYYHNNMVKGYTSNGLQGQRKHDSLDRFAGAIAKLRQHESIEPADVQKAYCIIQYMSKQIDVELED